MWSLLITNNINKNLAKTLSIGLICMFFILPFKISISAENFFNIGINIESSIAYGGSEGVTSKCEAGIFGVDYDIKQCVLLPLVNFGLTAISRVLYLAGILLNYSLAFSLAIANFVEQTPAVDLAWTAFRDLANMFFIFILLYIAIATILQLNNFDTRRFLTRLIVIALLINFSLFITNVVIDVSNVLAEGFYGGIVAKGLPKDISKIDGDGGISDRFMSGLKLQTIYDLKGKDANIETIFGETSKLITVILLGSVFILITAFTFLAAAIMFIIRTAVLIILMVLSPIAFAGHILPKTQGYAKEWWNTLFAQSFFAPVYLIMVWVVMKIIDGGSLNSDGQSFTEALMANANSPVGIIFNFSILIVLIMASLVVARKVAASGSVVLTNSAGRAIGTVAGGMGGWVGRNTLGRGARALANSEWMKNKAAQNNLRGSLYSFGAKGLLKAKSGSFDIRGTKAFGKIGSESGINFGESGGRGGYNTQIERQMKERAKFDSYLSGGADGDKRRKQYAERLRKPLGIGKTEDGGPFNTLWMKLAARKNKEAAEKIEKELKEKRDKEAKRIAMEENRKKIREYEEEMDNFNRKIKEGRDALEEFKNKLDKTGKEMTQQEKDVITKNMNKIRSEIREHEERVKNNKALIRIKKDENEKLNQARIEDIEEALKKTSKKVSEVSKKGENKKDAS